MLWSLANSFLGINSMCGCTNLLVHLQNSIPITHNLEGAGGFMIWRGLGVLHPPRTSLYCYLCDHFELHFNEEDIIIVFNYIVKKKYLRGWKMM